jgi:hypothetical protein
VSFKGRRFHCAILECACHALPPMLSLALWRAINGNARALEWDDGIPLGGGWLEMGLGPAAKHRAAKLSLRLVITSDDRNFARGKWSRSDRQTKRRFANPLMALASPIPRRDPIVRRRHPAQDRVRASGSSTCAQDRSARETRGGSWPVLEACRIGPAPNDIISILSWRKLAPRGEGGPAALE